MRRTVTALGLLAVLSGCTSSAMRKADPGTWTTPEPERARVVFLRPSSVGGTVQASVFDLDAGGDRFVGIVSAGTKVAYLTTPGEHLFMVIGENADFMQATLAAGKTYYALVAPRVGWWKARFSLRPIHREELSGSAFAKWDRDTEARENTEASERWARDHWPSIQAKKTGYLRKWDAKPPSVRAERALHVDDGV